MCLGSCHGAVLDKTLPFGLGCASPSKPTQTRSKPTQTRSQWWWSAFQSPCLQSAVQVARCPITFPQLCFIFHLHFIFLQSFFSSLSLQGYLEMCHSLKFLVLKYVIHFPASQTQSSCCKKLVCSH